MTLAIGILLFVLGMLGTLSLPVKFVSDYTRKEKLHLVASLLGVMLGVLLLFFGAFILVLQWQGTP